MNDVKTVARRVTMYAGLLAEIAEKAEHEYEAEDARGLADRFLQDHLEDFEATVRDAPAALLAAARPPAE